MMRISDPVIFGHAVRTFFPRLFSEYGDALAAAGGDPDEGLGAILQAAQKLPPDQRAGVEAAIREGLENGPARPMAKRPTPLPSSLTAATPPFTRSSSTIAVPMVRTTRRPWERFPTSG